SRRLADDHPLGLRVAYAEDSLCPAGMQATTGAAQHFGAERVPLPGPSWLLPAHNRPYRRVHRRDLGISLRRGRFEGALRAPRTCGTGAWHPYVDADGLQIRAANRRVHHAGARRRRRRRRNSQMMGADTAYVPKIASSRVGGSVAFSTTANNTTMRTTSSRDTKRTRRSRLNCLKLG